MDEWHVISGQVWGSLAAVLPLLGRKEIHSEVKGYFAAVGYYFMPLLPMKSST